MPPPARLWPARALALAAAAACLVGSAVLVGCGGGSAPAPAPRPAPDLEAFLRLPVATPASCPPDANGTTSGRRSPWVGTVDVSVFVADRAPAATVDALRGRLAEIPHVRTVYVESRRQAYEEFRRLYTCSDRVPRSAVTASYRLVLDDVTRAQRDALVRTVARLPGVRSVSCDPASPCIDVTTSGT